MVALLYGYFMVNGLEDGLKVNITNFVMMLVIIPKQPYALVDQRLIIALPLNKYELNRDL